MHSASASILKSRRAVFNIKDNDYRLIVAVAYKVGVVYVKFFGTHRQYDAIDAEAVEMGRRSRIMEIKPVRTVQGL